MKLHRIRWIDPDEGTCYSWFTSARAAREEAENMRTYDYYKGIDINIDVVHIPTDRAGLAGWLETNFTRDNG